MPFRASTRRTAAKSGWVLARGRARRPAKFSSLRSARFFNVRADARRDHWCGLAAPRLRSRRLFGFAGGRCRSLACDLQGERVVGRNLLELLIAPRGTAVAGVHIDFE